MHFMSLSPSLCSHDFIGEFTTSYKDLSRGQSQLNVYEVNADKDAGQYCYRLESPLMSVFMSDASLRMLSPLQCESELLIWT